MLSLEEHCWFSYSLAECTPMCFLPRDILFSSVPSGNKCRDRGEHAAHPRSPFQRRFIPYTVYNIHSLYPYNTLCFFNTIYSSYSLYSRSDQFHMRNVELFYFRFAQVCICVCLILLHYTNELSDLRHNAQLHKLCMFFCRLKFARKDLLWDYIRYQSLNKNLPLCYIFWALRSNIISFPPLGGSTVGRDG